MPNEISGDERISLIELAIVLGVALLLDGLLVPLTMQMSIGIILAT